MFPLTNQLSNLFWIFKETELEKSFEADASKILP